MAGQAPGQEAVVNEANLAMLESAAAAIEEILDQVAFVGGTTVELGH